MKWQSDRREPFFRNFAWIILATVVVRFWREGDFRHQGFAADHASAPSARGCHAAGVCAVWWFSPRAC